MDSLVYLLDTHILSDLINHPRGKGTGTYGASPTGSLPPLRNRRMRRLSSSSLWRLHVDPVGSPLREKLPFNNYSVIVLVTKERAGGTYRWQSQAAL